MSRTRNGSGVLPILLIIGALGAVAHFGIGPVVTWIEGIFEDADSVEVAVPPDMTGHLKRCTAEQLVKEKRCGDLPIVIIDAQVMPHIARNVSLAWQQGHKALLTKATYKKAANYRDSGCKRFKRSVESSSPRERGSCDKYPFQSTEEGGAGARTEEVPAAEQNRQGPAIGNTYTRHQMKDGDQFLVVITSPSKMATSPYTG